MEPSPDAQAATPERFGVQTKTGLTLQGYTSSPGDCKIEFRVFIGFLRRDRAPVFERLPVSQPTYSGSAEEEKRPLADQTAGSGGRQLSPKMGSTGFEPVTSTV